jgi:proteic killer suppression protein
MVGGYGDKRTRDFALGKRVKAFSGVERAARLKLDRLEAAVTLRDLAGLPGNHFEALKRTRKGQYSIRIAATGCSNQSHHRDPEWAACHHRRHCVASRAFLQHECGILAEPAKSL